MQWPADLEPVFKNFLEGLLQKEPEHRLSWPHLLYHPFVHDGEDYFIVLKQNTENLIGPLAVAMICSIPPQYECNQHHYGNVSTTSK